MISVTPGTQRRLCDSTSVYLFSLFVVTHVTSEEADSHLWYEVRVTYHHTTDSDQLVNVYKYTLDTL